MNEKSCAKTRIGLWGMPVSKHYVNLDALIIREYLHKKPEGVVDPSSKIKGIKISDLVDASFLYQSLRKPDFQRETSNWEPEKIVDLVESFLKGDFVPSIILWYSQDGKTFVIDGAHRLSALIAWVHDDYGDKEISINFFSNLISPEQKKIADKTRNLMAVRVGSYLDIQKALSFQANSSDKHKLFARNAGVLDFQIQWVGGSDPDIAENSFKKINQKATLIDPTEFQMIESRRKPNAIATRALIRAGVGHKYWGGLPDDAQLEIQKISKQVYDMLFIPPLEDRITTLELPVAGKGYSAESVRLIFDFVNLANDLVVNQRKLKEVNDDIDGAATIECLKKVSKIISRICSKDNRSLGLHPAVYFYSAAGRYQPTAFLAIVSLIMEFEKSDELNVFTQKRCAFEEILVRHKYLINQIVRKFGAGQRSLNGILRLYRH